MRVESEIVDVDLDVVVDDSDKAVIRVLMVNDIRYANAIIMSWLLRPGGLSKSPTC